MNFSSFWLPILGKVHSINHKGVITQTKNISLCQILPSIERLNLINSYISAGEYLNLEDCASLKLLNVSNQYLANVTLRVKHIKTLVARINGLRKLSQSDISQF